MIFKNSIKIHQKGGKNYYFHENYLKETNYFRQECIPTGCLPSAAVAFSGRGCLPLHPRTQRQTPPPCGGVSATTVARVAYPVADLREAPPPTARNVLNFMQFFENLAKSYVAPLSPAVWSPPSYGESWIRPCYI